MSAHIGETAQEAAARIGLTAPEPPRVLTQRLPAQTYARVFETDAAGAAILAELTATFYKGVVDPKGGIDAVMQILHANGQRQVIEFIVGRINDAHEGEG